MNPQQPQQPGYLGTNYPVPTDPSYYLGTSGSGGLGGLMSGGFNQETLASMFAPQGLQFTPYGQMATNPFLQLFMNDSTQATHLQHKQVPGMGSDPNQQPGMGY